MTRYATDYGAFEIDPMPGQPQVALCHSFFVLPDRRGQGLAHALKEMQNCALKQLGYNMALCTVSAGNAAQKRVLTKSGWRRMDGFSNRRIGGDTEVWGCHITR